VYRASRGDKIGDAIFEKFKINATPTELFVDKDGNEVDWIVGYGPPADKFLEKLQKVLTGAETYKALTARYAKEPTNVEVIFKLAQKTSGRYTMPEKAKELYQKVIALDPQGKAGNYTYEYQKATVPYTQAAEFELGQESVYSRKPDAAPLKAFIAKYPQSQLLKPAYLYLAQYYRYYGGNDAAGKADAQKFLEEYTAKYPQDASVLSSYVAWIIKQKAPLDKGIELAEKVKEIQGFPRNPEYAQNLAQLYTLKGDAAKADEEYGKDFIDGYVSNTVYALTGYANFWLEQNRNLDSVEAAADTAVKVAPASQWYTLQTVAGIYAKLNKPEKALAVYGPDFIKANMTDQSILASYAAFWSRQGKNLESALEAAKKSVELTSDYYNTYTLANILFKLKKYDEALKYAEKAAALVKPMAAKYEGFSTQQYDKLVKDIKDAIAKDKGGEVKK
jgi:tetratricopeptide (TPR) repeat protein